MENKLEFDELMQIAARNIGGDFAFSFFEIATTSLRTGFAMTIGG